MISLRNKFCADRQAGWWRDAERLRMRNHSLPSTYAQP